jgi:hypothetical protein
LPADANLTALAGEVAAKLKVSMNKWLSDQDGDAGLKDWCPFPQKC